MSGKAKENFNGFPPVLQNSHSPFRGLRPADEVAFHPKILSLFFKKDLLESHLHVLLRTISTTGLFPSLALELEWPIDLSLPLIGCLTCP